MKSMTEDLYDTKDVARVRNLLLKEQNNLCALSGIPVKPNEVHLDHAHDNLQLVRGTLHRHSNLTLGKLEGLWNRYLSHWYPHDLPTFLEQAAAYLKKPKDERYRHVHWMKKLQTKFNALTSKQRSNVLVLLGSTECCTNDTQRKKVFSKLLKDRDLGYTKILAAIERSKAT